MQWISTLKKTFTKVCSSALSPFKLLAAYCYGKNLNPEQEKEIRNAFITADFGTEFTESLLEHLKKNVSESAAQQNVTTADILYDFLITHLPKKAESLTPIDSNRPKVILFVGVNGSGKTTSLAKLGYLLKNEEKYQVTFGAGDTFRAAAVEQLRVWSEALSCPIVAQKTGADPAAVLFDAWMSAKNSESDFLLADTAGRLMQPSLAQELKKIVHALQKKDSSAPHEIFCVLDATLGQSSFRQVEWFNQTVGLTGLVLTKLDGTAKGGMIFDIYKKLNIPIRYIAFGEKITDLQLFDPTVFAKSFLKDL